MDSGSLQGRVRNDDREFPRYTDTPPPRYRYFIPFIPVRKKVHRCTCALVHYYYCVLRPACCLLSPLSPPTYTTVDIWCQSKTSEQNIQLYNQPPVIPQQEKCHKKCCSESVELESTDCVQKQIDDSQGSQGRHADYYLAPAIELCLARKKHWAPGPQRKNIPEADLLPGLVDIIMELYF